MNANEYSTPNVIMDTIHLIKKIIYIFDIIFQICYMIFIVFKIANGSPILTANIIILILSFSYLIYYLSTTKEFYTPKQTSIRKCVRISTKICKRLIDMIVIVFAVIQLYDSPADNIQVLTTLLIVGIFVLSIICDIIKTIIDNRFIMITSALKQDRYTLTNSNEFIKGISEKLKIPTSKPRINPIIQSKIKDCKKRCQFKARRKCDFEHKND